MINPKIRLFRLLKECRTYGEFESKAIAQAGWVLRPFVSAGVNVDKPWLLNFWNSNKA